MIALVESPWPILAAGIVIEAALAVALLRTGQGRILAAMFGIAGIVLIGLAVEWFVVTDREAVTDALYECAAAVEANDLERLFKQVAHEAKQTKNAARFVLERFEVQKVRINSLEVTVNRLASPPTAKTKFNVVGTGRDRLGEFPYQTYTQNATVEFRREGDAWLACGFSLDGMDLP